MSSNPLYETPERNPNVQAQLQGHSQIVKPPSETPDLSFNPYRPDMTSLQDAVDRTRKGYVVYQPQIELIVLEWQRAAETYQVQLKRLEERNQRIASRERNLERKQHTFVMERRSWLKRIGVTFEEWELTHGKKGKNEP